MKRSIHTSPELLESRIAPAGLVTATFLNGHLTIDGADGADHQVTIVKTGKTTFRVDGIATDINELAQTSENFIGALKQLTIEGGSGADTFELTKLRPLKTFTFHGNAGVDSLTTTNFKTRLNGVIDIALGSETGSIDFSGNRTVLHGALNLDLGGGGSATFGSPLTVVDGNVAITGGPGGDAVLISGATTLFKANLDFNGGDGDDSFTASGSSLKVKGSVAMDGGAGTDRFEFAADKQKFGSQGAPALVDLKLGVGPGSVTFAGASATVLGDLQVDLGGGGGAAQLNSAVTSVAQSVVVTGGAGNDTLGFAGRTTIGRELTFSGDTGDDVLTATGALFAVGRATTMDGGTGATSFDLDVSALAIGALTVTGGTSNDTVSIIADGTISGDVAFQLGLDGIGPSSTILQSRAGLVDGLQFGAALTIEMPGSTVDALTIANIQVAKAFVARTGENVSTIAISNLNAKSDFKLETGSGADVVTIDNVNTRDFHVDTESGADELRIERNPIYAGSSVVRGIATILTGIGADEIRIGNSTDPADLQVSFLRAMTLDAGDGANMRNDVIASNSFKFAPTIIATGGTLTETAAI